MVIYNKNIIIYSIVFIVGCMSNSNNKSNCKQYIIGKWSGKLVDKEIILNFNDDGTATFDYTNFGVAKMETKYTVDDCKVVVSNYPEGLIINRINDNEMSFSPIDTGLKKDIDIIYSINLTRNESVK